jgi:hypothetical protein
MQGVCREGWNPFTGRTLLTVDKWTHEVSNICSTNNNTCAANINNKVAFTPVAFDSGRGYYKSPTVNRREYRPPLVRPIPLYYFPGIGFVPPHLVNVSKEGCITISRR